MATVAGARDVAYKSRRHGKVGHQMVGIEYKKSTSDGRYTTYSLVIFNQAQSAKVQTSIVLFCLTTNHFATHFPLR